MCASWLWRGWGVDSVRCEICGYEAVVDGLALRCGVVALEGVGPDV
jgi:hypothetical protein